jgi:hypothetical protein
MLKEVVDFFYLYVPNFFYPDMFRHMVAILRASWVPDKDGNHMPKYVGVEK